jgi:hypothetical protein
LIDHSTVNTSNERVTYCAIFAAKVVGDFGVIGYFLHQIVLTLLAVEEALYGMGWSVLLQF